MNYFEKLYNQEIEFLDSGENIGQYNMDYDRQRAEQVNNGTKPALFRLFSWKPWCLSLGHNQNDDDVDYEAVVARGYDVVRRPTGGRGVFHSNEITYSFIINLDKELNQELDIHTVYKDIHLFFIKAFLGLGIDLDFEKSGTNFREFYKDSGLSKSCFASSARYEVSSRGKKVVGSAQRVMGRTLLQHGSILIGREHLEIVNLLKHKSEEDKLRLLKYIESKSISLNELADVELNYSVLSDRIFKEFNCLA